MIHGKIHLWILDLSIRHTLEERTVPCFASQSRASGGHHGTFDLVHSHGLRVIGWAELVSSVGILPQDNGVSSVELIKITGVISCICMMFLFFLLVFVA